MSRTVPQVQKYLQQCQVPYSCSWVARGGWLEMSQKSPRMARVKSLFRMGVSFGSGLFSCHKPGFPLWFTDSVATSSSCSLSRSIYVEAALRGKLFPGRLSRCTLVNRAPTFSDFNSD